MAGYRLTMRHGSQVDKLQFDSLDAALRALGELVGDIRREGNLPAVKALREFEPAQRVAGRVEISTGGWFGRTAGIDVMGDGSLKAFEGGIRRRELETGFEGSPFDVVARVLKEG